MLSAALKRFRQGMVSRNPARFRKLWQGLFCNGMAIKRHRKVPFCLSAFEQY
jgi:hypothetical protein